MSQVKQNSWGEKFPANHKILLSQADIVLHKLEKELQKSTCPTLNDLYVKDREKVRIQKGIFYRHGIKPNRKHGKNKVEECMGLYVFGKSRNGKVLPVYVGISRTIYRRLKQHGWGNAHNEASLAYLIAKHKHRYIKARSNFPMNKIRAEQSILKKYKVAVYPILNDYDLYFTEVYAAGIWGTKWNTFKTH